MTHLVSQTSYLERRHWLFVLLIAGFFTIPTSGAADLSVETNSAVVMIQQSGSTLPLNSTFNGFSAEKCTLATHAFSEDNAAMVALYDQLGPGVLEAGGESADTMVWNPNGSGMNTAEMSPADVDRVAAFLRKTNWKIIYLLNFSIGQAPLLSEPSPSAISAAAAHAAEEAAYVSSAMGDRLIGFEIGNEPGAYSTNGLRPPSFTFSDYESQWTVFSAAVRAAAPSAVFTGPGDSSYTPDFIADLGNQVNLVTEHYYGGLGLGSDDLQLLLTPGTYLNETVLPLLSSINIAVPVQYRFDEVNAFSRPMYPGDWFATALWAIDFEFTTALNHSSGVNFSTISGMSPIDTYEGLGTVTFVNPMFYAMKLVSLAADGDLLKTSVSAQQSTLSAYAVASNNGTTYVVLNNKDSANAVETTIRFMQPVTSAEATILTAPSLTSGVGTTLGGAVIDKDGAWSSPQTEHVSISGGNAVITVAPGSAVFINAAPATTSIGIPQSGLCVASTQDSASGPYIQQEQCESGSSSQAFAFVPTIDGHYYIRPQNSNLCLDWQNPNSAVLQTTCSHSNTQEWSLVSSANSTYTLKTGNGEYCMNVRYGYTSPGTPMNTWRCNNLELYTLSDPPKRPLTTTSSTITVSNDRYCMDVMGMTFAVGAHIQQHNCTGGSNESFALSSTTDGYYSISSNLNNLCLNAESTNSYIIQQTCNGSSAQKWQLKSNLDGSYSFQEENTRDCLGIANGSTSWGTLFSTLSCDESAGQKLWLSKAPTMD